MTRLLLCILFLTSLAFADDMRPAARTKYQQGLSAYQAKRYPDAIESFKAAYALDARPEILFAWAQAVRLSGDCDSAVPLYRKVLADTTAAKREPIQALIDKCQPAPPPAVAAPALPPERPPFYRDVLGDVLVGAGVVAVGTGVTLLILSGASKDATTYDGFADQVDTAHKRRVFGGIVLGVGVGLTTAGILRWVFRSSPKDAPALTFYRSGGATFFAIAGDL
jgi:tetratricopeptide (TPR) repeat protein